MTFHNFKWSSMGLVVFFFALACSDPAPGENSSENDSDPDVSVDDVSQGYDSSNGDREDADIFDEDTSGGDEPQVTFLSPEDGAVVDNPVRFRIAATGVDEVEIFADETYSLGPPFDPTVEEELLYRFAGTGFARSLHVVGRVDGDDVAREDLTITVTHDSCEERFFITEFDQRNTDSTGEIDLVAIREAGLEAVKNEIDELQSCGAGLTLGGMLSLLLYEGGFRAGAFNTRCNENSYHNTDSDCDVVAEALYSYQFGIGAIHTSNFHPCKGGSWTQGMRQNFLDAAAAAGFSTDPDLIDAYFADRFAEICPDDTPTAVDYYILGAHEPFGIPRNDAGNALEAVGDYPLLDPGVSVEMTFSILHGSCADIDDDRDAISRWGGGDSRYSEASFQDQILAHYENFASANCD